ncbi:MAG: heavy metal translocating P-type ATPase [Solirubrobacterales bacterium]
MIANAVKRIGRDGVLATFVLVAIAVGGALHLADLPTAGNLVWGGATVVVLVPLAVEVARTLAGGRVGVDAIALLAMTVAVALGEYLAGVVVALMLAGGNTLEAYASGRARRELRTLLERAPRRAQRYRDGEVEEVDVSVLVPGDVVLVRTGEVLPVDGVVGVGSSAVDESTVTGESLPRSVRAGSAVRSGTVNVGSQLEVKAQRSAEDSTYAGIVRLVRAAEEERAPFVRLADRYSAIFLPLTLAVAGAAWLLSGDPVRALAVLVVATPCPLILATPVAIISGVSRAASRGIVVKGGGTIEALGEAHTVLLDKTGTLTKGEPEISDVALINGIPETELVRLAASLDQSSAHVLAEALVVNARRRGLELTLSTDAVETPGQGIRGTVDGRRVAVGRLSWLEEHGVDVPSALPSRSAADADPGVARVYVAVDGQLAGIVRLADRLRPDSEETLAALQEAGIERLRLVTGDDAAVAQRVARLAGIEDVAAECTPEDKLELVRSAQQVDQGGVVMVGDGVNDAPALALADVGIAMGARGATAASESADAVLTVDRVDRVADAIRIGRRSLMIARQSILVGMGLSVIAMGFAAFGYITPVAGALLQEAIDLGVILNALRALRPGPDEPRTPG